MKRRRWFYPQVLLLCAWMPSAVAQQVERIVIEPLYPGQTNEIVFDGATGFWTGTNMVVRYGPTVLTARTISLNEETGAAFANGDVRLQQNETLWRGESLAYNFQTGGMQSDAFRVGLPGFFAAGEGLAGQTNRTYSATNVFLTTDDYAKPSYRVQARRVTIVPGDSIRAEHAVLYLGRVPVLYLPQYHRKLGQRPNHFVLTPGYRSAFGPFLLGAYNWTWSTNLSGRLHLDYRQKRGVAGGPEVDYRLGPWGDGHASGYFLRDQDPRVGPDGLPVPENRYRIEFSHQVQIRSNLTARVVADKQSDTRVAHDFFETDYRHNPQPKSFLEVNQLWSNFSLNALAQPQLNDFFQTVERLPDVKLTGFRQQLGVSPFFYESESSAGYFRFEPAEWALTNDYSAMRADTFHQLLLPQTYFGWLNVTPRVGGRFTYYSETDGENVELEEQHRAVFNTGAEASFKASRIWRNARSQFWDVTELRHIIQPSINYVFVPEPNVRPFELPRFDSEIPSLRLLSIEFPDYNSIDSIDSQNVLRISLRNKVQTKRRGEIDNLVHWGLYTDWRIDPNDGQTTFADLFSDLDLKPRSWMTLSSEVRYDLHSSRINFANNLITLEPNDVWSVSFGHLYFRGGRVFGPESENNVIRSSIWYRFNENWAARVTHHYEIHHGVLEEQYYTIYRDLRSWTAALTFRARENRAGEDDFTIALTFSLKAFPRYSLGRDKARHYMLLGS